MRTLVLGEMKNKIIMLSNFFNSIYNSLIFNKFNEKTLLNGDDFKGKSKGNCLDNAISDFINNNKANKLHDEDYLGITNKLDSVKDYNGPENKDKLIIKEKYEEPINDTEESIYMLKDYHNLNDNDVYKLNYNNIENTGKYKINGEEYM
jgi:hypothetical protein